VSGYRFYDAAQLSQLNRLVALKELGFTLEQVRSILVDAISADELRGMLRMRQAQLQSQIAADALRLTQVEARFRIIDAEGKMPTDDIQIKRIPAVRVAELTASAEGLDPQSIGPVIGPLYTDLMSQLERADVLVAGPAIAYYEHQDDGRITVHAAVPIVAVPRDDRPFAVVDLPEIEQAATIVHHGSMDSVLTTVQTLARWIEATGHTSTGFSREHYLVCGAGDPDTWVTELQEPIALSEGHRHD